MLLGTPALVIAGLVALGGVAAGIVGPWLHRRNPVEQPRTRPAPSSPVPVEARRAAGPSWFTGPGA
ncbi:hypothetical protein [Modestobacter excelsi]|uniref:hypothetical protein n=1 Tax=Modestobacter excelsi TaxID=2213161 RepID=UPI00110D19A0|nr:hypothetical protein [Modestobacter excelsi]